MQCIVIVFSCICIAIYLTEYLSFVLFFLFDVSLALLERKHFLSMTTVQLGKFYPEKVFLRRKVRYQSIGKKHKHTQGPNPSPSVPKFTVMRKARKGKKNGGRRRQSSDSIIRIAVE